MKPEALAEAHQFFSTDCFNACWSFIDKRDRTAEEAVTMVALAHASLWHWQSRPDCRPSHVSTSLWQVARAHALAGQPDAARWYAGRCLTVSRQAGLAPFFVGFAHEAACRAEVVAGRRAEAEKSLELATREMEAVADAEERKLLADDLDGLRQALSHR